MTEEEENKNYLDISRILKPKGLIITSYINELVHFFTLNSYTVSLFSKILDEYDITKDEKNLVINEFSSLLSGAALIEIVCSWPGLGSLMLTAVRAKDIYLVMASFMMGGVLFLIGNLLADILLARLDPRIRYEK